jgi:hypothetical protein
MQSECRSDPQLRHEERVAACRAGTSTPPTANGAHIILLHALAPTTSGGCTTVALLTEVFLCTAKARIGRDLQLGREAPVCP